MARSGAPAARSTAKSTANAIEYTPWPYVSARANHESTWYLNQLGARYEWPTECRLRVLHVVENGRNSSRKKKEKKNEYALYTANTNYCGSLCTHTDEGSLYLPRMFALRAPNISRRKLYAFYTAVISETLYCVFIFSISSMYLFFARKVASLTIILFVIYIWHLISNS